ncbi:acyltransferase [Mariprofundus ferrooxydans]|nr:acyltransferase [Mariprofundus ferrooxydans]
MKFIRKWYRRFFPKRPCCMMEEGACLHPQSHIVNMKFDKQCIVIGKSTHILGELLTFKHGGEIHIGDECFVSEDTRIWAASSIYIGNRVLISHQVNIFDSQTHPLSARKRSEHFKVIFSTGHPDNIDLSERPVVIDDDVWIGCSSIILRGVHVGQGAVIGAGSVVTKDVPEWTVVAGNPAKEIRAIPEHER